MLTYSHIFQWNDKIVFTITIIIQLLLYQLQEKFKLIFTEYSLIVVTEDDTAYLKLYFPNELFKFIGLKHYPVAQNTLTNTGGCYSVTVDLAWS